MKWSSANEPKWCPPCMLYGNGNECIQFESVMENFSDLSTQYAMRNTHNCSCFDSTMNQTCFYETGNLCFCIVMNSYIQYHPLIYYTLKPFSSENDELSINFCAIHYCIQYSLVRLQISINQCFECRYCDIIITLIRFQSQCDSCEHSNRNLWMQIIC